MANKVFGAIDDITAKTSGIWKKNSETLGKLDEGRKAPLSIAGMAKKSLFEFPVFISTSVDYKYAEAACGLVELTYGSYLQMAIALCPSIPMSYASDPFSSWKTDVSNYLECSDLTYTFDACHNVITEDGVTFEFDMLSIPDSYAAIINEYAEYEPLSEFDHYFQEAGTQTYDPDDALNNKDIQDLIKFADYGLKLNKDQRDQIRFNFEQLDRNDVAQAMPMINKFNEDMEKYNKGEIAEKPEFDDIILPQKLEEALKNLDERKERAWNERERAWNEKYRNEKRRADLKKLAYDTATRAPEVLDESKVQKLNSLKPLMMNVQLKAYEDRKDVPADNKGIQQTMNYVVGVKTYSRLIKSETLPEVAEYPLIEMDRQTRQVRYKAGELKFFRDIMFRISQKKQTAVDSKDPNRKWYRRLYELAHTTGDSASVRKLTKGKGILLSRLRDKLLHFGKTKDHAERGFIPNATIMISKEDVDNVLAEKNIDLLNPGTAFRFCRELFLMNFVVIDLNAQTIKVLTPDQHKDFEIHTLASVEKQLALLDSSAAASREIFKVLKK